MNRRSFFAVTLLTAALVLLAGCVREEGDTAGPTAAGRLLVCPGTERTATPSGGASPTAIIDEVLRRDAEAYAESHGVSVGEAILRLELVDLWHDMNLPATLREREAATLAGIWIEHEPEFRFVIAFTRDGEETLCPYVAGTPLIDVIELRTARFSYAELEAVYAETTRELGKLDFEANAVLAEQNNRVEVRVSDRAWFESELERVEAHLPEGVELVVVEGGTTARDKDRLLTPPVPGIAFPRQKPVEGYAMSMMALASGRLVLEEGCLRLEGGALPIWPPGFTLRVEGEQVLIIDGGGGVAARAGEEVCMGGGHSAVTDEWVLQQIPSACRGDYWIVGSARPNLTYDSDLFTPEVVSTPEIEAIFLRYKPALEEQASPAKEVTGRLALDKYQRCLQLDAGGPGGDVHLFWPQDWSLSAGDGEVAVLDGIGQVVGRVGESVSLRVREVPSTWEDAVYQQLVNELPCSCMGGMSWLVDGVP